MERDLRASSHASPYSMKRSQSASSFCKSPLEERNRLLCPNLPRYTGAGQDCAHKLHHCSLPTKKTTPKKNPNHQIQVDKLPELAAAPHNILLGMWSFTTHHLLTPSARKSSRGKEGCSNRRAQVHRGCWEC